MVVRHAESIENADEYSGFYHDRRPYDGRAAHEISRNIVGLTRAASAKPSGSRMLSAI